MVFNPGYPSELPGHLKRICVQASPQTSETSVSGDDIQASGTFKAPQVIPVGSQDGEPLKMKYAIPEK